MPEANLLVSVHDVSPFSLAEATQAVALVNECGIPDRALTLLVIPDHEGRARLTDHPHFVAWLQRRAGAGATLVAHGLRHRMQGVVAAPLRALWAYGFAAGQAEFYNATRAQAATWFQRITELFRNAGLPQALNGFVPPAWLLSEGARAELAQTPFSYLETLGGLESGGKHWAPRLIGWGARSRLESLATVAYAEAVSRLPPADLRLAIHPGDLHSPLCVRSIRRCLERLNRVSRARCYADFLAHVADPPE
jgi:predicted deacetylase